MNYFFHLSCCNQASIVPSFLIHLLLIQKMKASSLLVVAGSTTLLRKHLLSVQTEFDKLDVRSSAKHSLPILALLKSIGDDHKTVVRIQQVQRAQINKYQQSIRTGRKAKRGEHVPTDMITDVMIPMTLRVIQDLKDLLPELTQPLITRIHAKLHDLHDRMSLFQMFVDTIGDYQDDCIKCQCNSVGISCHACHQGAHEQCLCNCTE